MRTSWLGGGSVGIDSGKHYSQETSSRRGSARRLSLPSNIPLNRLLVVGIWPATGRISAPFGHSSQELPAFRLVDETVVIGVDALEAIFEERRRFLFRQFAIAVGIRRFQPLADLFGVHPPETTLAGPALARTGPFRAALASRRNSRAARRSSARTKNLIGRQLAVAVAVEFEQGRARANDLASRELAVAVRV